jgi:hypothetical protein
MPVIFLSAPGLASFMYSKKLRNTNNAYYDPFCQGCQMEYHGSGVYTKGNTRYYEWRINLGDQLMVGKTIGIDFQVFDLDSDKSFSFASWGTGEMKYVNPRSLSDVSLEIRETPFGKSFGHGGNNGDYKCKFEVYKDLKMGYVIFTNSNTSDVLLEKDKAVACRRKE